MLRDSIDSARNLLFDHALEKRWKFLKYQIKCPHRVQVVEGSDKGNLTGKYVCMLAAK
jgi:hypothetical protein